ncbi:methylthioribose-1-phosphate isomerase [Elysia marginata]|uniref:Methylthioribose-1-phosphate isomerase n=1 Tax=Elysia marginata TaxID=1093978 RepID=A0AAV4EPA7_9GAST|nr:methylthioribose-1-phosphate isomerase [Elysia marginata]
MTLQAIRYSRGCLEILDQLLLPDETKYFSLHDTKDGWSAIKKMQVRGAPAIAIVGCLSLAVELTNSDVESVSSLKELIENKLDYLVSARPTASNMAEAASRIKAVIRQLAKGDDYKAEDAKLMIIKELEGMLEEDININKNLGKYGAEHLLGTYAKPPVNIITHCNTGSLATAGYGTALGVIRYLQENEKLGHVYCTETRPYNQGARLTAYELLHENIDASLICDSAAAACMKEKNIHAVIVGADRVTANGDAANKIGTCQIAIAAKYYNIPFYVACPRSTFDPSTQSGEDIIIEQRPHAEMTSIKGIKIAADINCWNPAFDVTPAELITGGIITEYGVFKPHEVKQRLQDKA